MHVALGDLDEPVAAASRAGADWAASIGLTIRTGPSGASVVVYASDTPAPDEHVLEHAAQALLLGQPPEHLAPQRQRERHLLEAVDADTSSTTSISRVTSRARQVGTVTTPAAPRPRSRAAPGSAAARRAGSRARRPRRSAPAAAASPAAPEVALHVDLARVARLRQLDEQLVA